MPRQIVTKSISGAMLVAFMLTSSVERAEADLKNVLGGAAAAVIIGCASGAINCKKKSKRRSTSSSKSTRRRSTVNSAQRQQNREVQSALNSFGFPVGTVDGSLGPKSRGAIRDYQGYMGYPATGQLTDYERQLLVNGSQKFQAGAGNAYPRTMAAVGPRGLLNIERDPGYPAQFGDNVGQAAYNNQGGYNNTNQGGFNNNQNGGTWDQTNPNVAPNQQAFQQPQPIQPLAPAPQQGGQVIGGGGVPKLQPLKPLGQVAVSAAARCKLVEQTTRIQGGVIRASNMTDSNQALSEKFCEAHGFAITQGGTKSAQFAVSDGELNTLCEQIKTGFSDVVKSLPSAQPAQAVAAAQGAANQLGLGGDPATAKAYGQICLGIGYREDNAEMALAGVLTMLATGERPYGELIGHHLREGFGVTAAPASASPWYMDAITALEQGAQPAFVPSTTPERIQVIRAALQLQEQRASGNAVMPQIIPASNKLPALQPINN